MALRRALDTIPALKHLALRESIIFEKGPGSTLETRVKTFELRPRRER